MDGAKWSLMVGFIAGAVVLAADVHFVYFGISPRSNFRAVVFLITGSLYVCLFIEYGQQIENECYKLLKEAYGENSLSRADVFEWYKRAREHREMTWTNQRPGRPVSVSTPQTVTKINEIVHGDRRMSIRMIGETVNADKETVRKILHELNMKKVCAKLVPKN
ncbi:hypothetical protein NQ317_009562 [Molorchus minor]|uniref:Mos1 transposase HTH domain-containing protein n=1 Tax=Molorchus minor TaxID=1323400 RepID=A0ABQ9JJ06_9CUCU|nr:hypothetical protein NQ317_009562 [Molorchus minor]